MITPEQREATLRMSTVYPGHPCLIAMQIMCSFPSYVAAEKRTKAGWPEALACSDVRGAGGAVYQGLTVLRQVCEDSKSAEEAFEFGCMLWQRSRESDHSDALEEGNAAAEKSKADFIAMAENWFSQQPVPQAAQEAAG